MPDAAVHVLDLLSRYLHIVSTTMLVGGTLFYEWIVPAAIGELKREHQLDVFGRARWFFRTLVWISAGLLVLSGIVNSRKHWAIYEGTERPQVWRVVDPQDETLAALRRPGWWWVAHVSTASVALLIAIYITTTRRPPEHPVGWMRINLVILLIVIFLASATQHMRQVVVAATRGEVRVPFVAQD